MIKVKILLADLGSENDDADQLQAILEGHDTGLYSFQIRREQFHGTDTSEASNWLSSLCLAFVPAVTFLLIGSRALASGAELSNVLRAKRGRSALVAVADAGPAELTEMLRQGATDYLVPPLRAADVVPRLWRLALNETGEEDRSVQELKEELGLTQFIGESPSLLAEIKKIPTIAPYAVPVLLTGETGTGKEVCARAIHCLGSRSDKPFLALNCGAFPTELLENELFGHAAGAFTSATQASVGLLRQADGGTVFLDEIDAFPLPQQVKLLRFLQDKEIQPLGSQKAFRVDVRIIAASNVDLELATAAGGFRQDLYYRLDVTQLTMPPLRQRVGDIPLLARHFQERFARELGRPCKVFTSEAMQKLMRHSWPGNVRELENLIERAVIFSEHSDIRGEDIQLSQPTVVLVRVSLQEARAKAVAEFERKSVQEFLRDHAGNITHAARAAGKNRRAFWYLMRKHKIQPSRQPPFT